MLSQSMEGYFKHSKHKTYIDKYPKTIVTREELKDKILVEFGSGTGNDMKFLIEHGFEPASLFLIEADLFYFTDAMDALERDFGRHYNPNHFFLGSIFENPFPSGFANIVYANNLLHCLGYRTMNEDAACFCDEAAQHLNIPFLPKEVQELWRLAALRSPNEKIAAAVCEAYRLLGAGGIFFGRMLSDSIDSEKLHTLERNIEKTEREVFALKTARSIENGELTGVSLQRLETYARDAGFMKLRTELKESWKPTQDFYFRFEKS